MRSLSETACFPHTTTRRFEIHHIRSEPFYGDRYQRDNAE
jgi:hypothetical protein